MTNATVTQHNRIRSALAPGKDADAAAFEGVLATWLTAV
jgi:hypothetical protein